MLGFLLQWPTLLTLVMFPVLVVMYARLARMEEHEALREFEDQYRGYMFIALLPPQWGMPLGTDLVGIKAYPLYDWLLRGFGEAGLRDMRAIRLLTGR